MARYRERSDVPDEYRDRYAHGQTWLLWPNRQTGPWLLRLQWTRIDGRLECCGLEIRSFREGKEEWPAKLPDWREARVPLTTKVLRDLNIAEIIRDLREDGYRQSMAFADQIEGDDELAEEFRTAASRARGRRRPGVAPLDEVAATYRSAYDKGESTTKAIAARFSVSDSTAAKWVMRARDAGALPPSGRKPRKGRKS